MDQHTAATAVDPVSLLPIDITYSKLADWLVDRKKMPADWRKKVASLRLRIATAFSTLPLEIDPWLQTCDLESIGYLEAGRIRDLLVQSNPDSRNFFGRLSGIAGEWDTIVRAYEKELLNLGEAAQLMVQFTDYEIPYQKKQLAKIQQQLTDMERKESEFKRSAASAAVKYQQACQELGIEGKDVRAELMALGKVLPSVFMEVVKAVCNKSVGESLELYQAFVSCADVEAEAESKPILPTLHELRDNPPTILAPSEVKCELESSEPRIEKSNDRDKIAIDTENKIDDNDNGKIGSPTAIVWDFDQQDNGNTAVVDVDNTDQMNWGIEGVDTSDITAEVEESTGIDWGIGMVSKEPMAAEGISNIESGIVWDLGDLTAQTPESKFDVLQQESSAVSQGGDTGGEINWDIDLDESGVDQVEQVENSLPSKSSSKIEQGMGDVGRFLETEYRNMLLNDLFELKAFVKQRVEELGRHDSASLQNQVQAMAPAACFQHSTDALLEMALHVTAALDLLTAQKTRDLSLLVTSSRFLDRLHSSLLSKKESETKLLASSRDLCQKRAELRQTLTLLWPKQELALKRTCEAKEHAQECISNMYEGRPVNIIGTINTVLGLTCGFIRQLLSEPGSGAMVLHYLHGRHDLPLKDLNKSKLDCYSQQLMQEIRMYTSRYMCPII